MRSAITKRLLVLVFSVFFAISSIILPIVSQLPTVSALSPEQKKLFDKGIYYFNYKATCGTASSTTVTPGDGSPTGLTFPNLDPTAMANAINKYIKKINPSSKLNNLGSTIVASGKNANVNPFVAVVIARMESNLADPSPSQWNVVNANNSFGREGNPGQNRIASPTRPGVYWYKWSSVKASVDYTARENKNVEGGGDELAYLQVQYGDDIKSNNLDALITSYAPPSENDTAQYIANAKKWIGEMASMAGGSDSTPASSGPDYTPAAPTPADASTPATDTADGSTSAPTIVLDPGHAPKANENVDPVTKEPVFDYENEPEMKQVWQVAQNLKTKLTADGYTVLITKKSLNDTSTNLKKRAEVANKANAALGVSLHTNPGASQVYYPAVGDYIVKTTGKHDVYSNHSLAATDKKDAQTMGDALKNAENGSSWQVGTYASFYDSISREQNGVTMKGTMLTTQYFAKVPWVYVEQAQDAPGASVSPDMLSKYEAGVLKGIEDIVPPPATASSDSCCASDGPGALTGSDNVEKTANFFMEQGLSPAQAAGVTANFMWETGGGETIDPLIAGPTPSGDAWGIAEWTPPSHYTDDKSHMHITGDDADLLTQLEVVWGQIQGKGTVYSTNILPGLQKIDNAGDAATYFRENFERCDTSNDSCTTKRVDTANKLVGELGDGSVGGGSTASCVPDGSPTGTVEAAVQAAKQLSSYKIGYVWGGLHAAGDLDVTDQTKLRKLGADCSGSVSWVLHQAGMFKPSAASVSGAFSSWGEPGKGKEMTIWENADHIFIEFNVPGLGHYQLNTSYGNANGLVGGTPNPNTPHSSGAGPQFFPWGQNGQADAEGGAFTPRHWPGT